MHDEQISIIPEEVIITRINMIRGQKIMLDADLAELYGVETKQLKRSVRRNEKRFPEDFMFDLSQKEFDILRCQFGTSRWGGARYLPMAFTEQGVAMLSGILKSECAILVNIRIIRIFTRLREIMKEHKDIVEKLEKLDHKLNDHDNKFLLIFEYLKQLEQTKQENLVLRPSSLVLLIPSHNAATTWFA